ncbi:MAG: APC family permease [Magnetospirillum sp.]|nr:APC family permease [Magnetospirillum sp.]
MNLRRLLFGDPLETAALEHQRLGKVRALAIFSSDALSSVAYATEEILLVLVAGGAAALSLSLPIALVITLLLAIVTLSYRQTIHAYPSGGGAFVVAYDNLGELPGLVAAAALLIDYVLTVAVSITAGVRAITSAFPAWAPWTVPLCLIAILLVTWGNLRGVRESAGLFAVPTYLFIAAVLTLLAVGATAAASGRLHPVAGAVPAGAAPLTLLLVLRAFSSGCSAMTGVEAISNGVPAFRRPARRNASATLIAMAVLLGTMFLGITTLANLLDVLPREDESVLSQVARGVFGEGAFYYGIQAATALILLLAANTSFTGFPLLASILAKEGYLPRQLANLGDRLAFTNGIAALAGLAAILVVVFDGSPHGLVPLYAIGVFLSFTLSQVGMVKRWQRVQGAGWGWKALINGLGAAATALALAVIIESKFTQGAWMTLLLIPGILMLFRVIHRQYVKVDTELSPRAGGTGLWLRRLDRAKPKVVVPVAKIHRGTLAALHFARSLSDDVTAVTVDVDRAGTANLRLAWRALAIREPLVVLPSRYRSIIAPLMAFLEEADHREPQRGQAVVVLPLFVPSRWWHHLLHNQTALMLKAALLFRSRGPEDARIIIDVPYRLAE